jgi:hypothetical protein
MIKEGELLLKEGDLVVRLNKDLESDYIRFFNRKDKQYSHSGLVFFEEGHPLVFHIYAGKDNPEGWIRKEPLHLFCDPERNASFGIYRYDLNAKEKEEIRKIIYSYYERKIKFDTAFNLRTDDRMYCSEMIKKGLEKATKNRIIIETTALTQIEAALLSFRVNIPGEVAKKMKIVSIDNLYITPHCDLIKEYKFLSDHN